MLEFWKNTRTIPILLRLIFQIAVIRILEMHYFILENLYIHQRKKRLICQEFAIKEHLSRALTDAASAVLDVLTWTAESMLRDNDVLDEWKIQIRIMLHQMKKLFLRKRFGGMMISSDEIKVDHAEIIKICDSFIAFSCENCKKKFAEHSRSYAIRFTK